MYKPKCCGECPMRLIDTEHGDSCILTGLSIMDNRFKYEYELNRVYSCRNVCCPIDKEERDGKVRQRV